METGANGAFILTAVKRVEEETRPGPNFENCIFQFFNFLSLSLI
jgi:hypothetical protein